MYTLAITDTGHSGDVRLQFRNCLTRPSTIQCVTPAETGVRLAADRVTLGSRSARARPAHTALVTRTHTPTSAHDKLTT
jgi:hypothetical protein